MSAGLRRLLALALALSLAALPPLLEQAAAPPSGLLLHGARFGETVDDEAARAVLLPHRWQADCAHCRTVWYRFDLPLTEAPRDARALYLSAAGQNAAIYLNGRLLAQGGRFTEPLARMGQRPLWALTSPSLWQAGDNRLYVLVKADRARAGFLSAPAIGPEDDLQWALRLSQLQGQSLPQLLTTACVMLALVMGLIAFYRRHAAGYLLLATAAVLQALQAWSAWVLEPAWAAGAWDAWLVGGRVLAAAAVAALALHLGGVLSARRPLQAAALVAGAGLVAALAVAADGSGAVVDAVQRMALALGAGTGAWLAWRGWRRGDARLLVPGVVLALLSLADILRPLADPGAMPWQPWALALFFGAAAWLLLLRFVETLNTLELLNIDLEDLVRVRTTELQAQFERVRELERRQTIASERERLMRDMHDGVGGHLVSLLAMIEAGRSGTQQLSTAVRDALDDMRLMIDSLEPVDDDLNAVLAMWNDRLAPRLRAVDVVLHWEVAMLPPVPGLTPARVLHVLRILQEAVTNAVRHGRAQTLWLTAGVDAATRRVQLTLRDDGCGFDPDVASTGRGLKNMRRRAAEVGAALVLSSRPGSGTELTLSLPLEPAATGSAAGP